MNAKGGKKSRVKSRWPNGSFCRTNGENPNIKPAITWAGTNLVTVLAAKKQHQPETTGATVAATLNEAIGPYSQVIGANTTEGNIHEVFTIMLAPPWPA